MKFLFKLCQVFAGSHSSSIASWTSGLNHGRAAILGEHSQKSCIHCPRRLWSWQDSDAGRRLLCKLDSGGHSVACLKESSNQVVLQMDWHLREWRLQRLLTHQFCIFFSEQACELAEAKSTRHSEHSMLELAAYYSAMLCITPP